MSAITNHMIGAACCNGYGRSGAAPVWNSALLIAGRVDLIPHVVMGKKTAATAAHTPGPWELFGESENEGESHIIQSSDRVVACTTSRLSDDDDYFISEEDLANANLIAAAPKLLDACHIALGLLKDGNVVMDRDSEVQEIRIAIDKAAGR